MDWQWLFFSFEGRIPRKPFWMAMVIFIMVSFIANRADTLHLGMEPGTGPISGLASLLLVWPVLAISAKRWHDRDRSAWWILIGFVPLIGFVWTLIENGFLKGTDGENRFGPDPLDEVTQNRPY